MGRRIAATRPAAEAAYEVHAAQLAEEADQDFSAVILQMEKQEHLDYIYGGRTGIGASRNTAG